MASKTFSNTKDALNYVKNSVNRGEKDRQRKISSEFVRLNAKNVPKQTGQARRSIITNSRYESGDIIAATPYIRKIWVKNLTGKPEWFLYTLKEHKEDLIELEKKLIDKDLS